MKTIGLWMRACLMLAAIIVSFSGATTAFAVTSHIECADASDLSKCTIDNVSPGFAQVVANAISQANSIDSTGSCTVGNNGTVSCTLATAQNAPLSQIVCSLTDVQAGTKSASCSLQIGAETLGRDVFALDCTASEINGVRSGSCTLNSDEAQIKERLSTNTSLNTNQINVGTNLLAGCAMQGGINSDGSLSAFQRDCNALSAVFGQGNNEAVTNFINQVTPHNPELGNDVSRNSLAANLGSLSARMARLRTGTTRSFDTAGLQYFDGYQWVSPGMLLASGDNVATDAVSPIAFPSNRLGVFVDGSLLRGTQSADALEDKTTQKGQTFTLGIDYRITNSLVAGVAFSNNVTDVDFGDSSTLRTVNYNLLGYATYYVDQWYVEGTMARGGDHHDQNRHMLCSSATCGVDFDVMANARYFGKQLSSTLTTGYDLNFGALTVTPSLQYAIATVHSNGFNETADDPTAAGAGFLLALDGSSRDTRTGSAGVNAQYAISTGIGVILPHVSYEMKHEFNDKALLIDGHFVGDVSNDSKFLLNTRQVDTTYGLLGAGLSMQMTGGSSTFVDVKTVVGYENLSQKIYSAGFRWEI